MIFPTAAEIVEAANGEHTFPSVATNAERNNSVNQLQALRQAVWVSLTGSTQNWPNVFSRTRTLVQPLPLRTGADKFNLLAMLHSLESEDWHAQVSGAVKGTILELRERAKRVVTRAKSSCLHSSVHAVTIADLLDKIVDQSLLA